MRSHLPRSKSIALVSLIALSCAASLSAQTFGEITGVVTDTSGGVIVGATVTVTNPATSLTRTATTNNAGNYSFPALLPGTYNIKAEMQGLRTEVRSGVELQVQ